MEKGRMLSDLKEIVYDLMDNNGNSRVEPIGLVGSRKLPDSRLDLLRSFITLLLDTKILSDETRLYVFDRHISIEGVNDNLNNLEKNKNKTIPLLTTKSKINYDRSKLERLFGRSMLGDIVLRENNNDKMGDYMSLIVDAMMKYRKDKTDLRENIALNLDKTVLCKELTEEQFDSFKLTIMPYLKSHMEMLAKTIDSDSVGYFNYLLYSPKLSEVDKQRLEELKQILEPSDTLDEQIDIE